MKIVMFYDQGYRCPDLMYSRLKSAYLNYKHAKPDEVPEAKKAYDKAISDIMQKGTPMGEIHGPYGWSVDEKFFQL